MLASGFQTNELVAYDISGEYWLDDAGTNDGENSVGGEIGVGKYLEHARNRLKANVFTLALKGYASLNRHNIDYGIEYRYQSVYDRSSEWEMRDSAGYALPNTDGSLRMFYNLTSRNDLTTNKISWYAQDTYKLYCDLGLFSFNGGIRMSYWDFNREFLVSPRVSIGFVPERNSSLTFRLSGGLYYQSPFYKEFRVANTDENGNSYQTLNSDIKSQRSIQVILGSDYTFRAMDRPFKLTAEAYYKNLANLIPYELDNLQLVYSGRNASSGYIAGVDFKLFGQFVPGTDSWISFSLMKTQETLNGVKVPRPTDQRYSIGLFFTDYFPKFPKLKFSLRGVLSDGLPMTPPQVTRDVAWSRMPAYKRLDIGFQYQLLGNSEGVRPQFLAAFQGNMDWRRCVQPAWHIKRKQLLLGDGRQRHPIRRAELSDRTTIQREPVCLILTFPPATQTSPHRLSPEPTLRKGKDRACRLLSPFPSHTVPILVHIGKCPPHRARHRPC